MTEGSSRLTPAVAARMKEAIDEATDASPLTGRDSELTKALIDAASDMERKGSTRVDRSATSTDKFTLAQLHLLRWVGGVLVTAAFGWGIWITVELFAVKTSLAISQAQYEAIKAQLLRMEIQLTDIQKELRVK
jgi:hypothetical protein